MENEVLSLLLQPSKVLKAANVPTIASATDETPTLTATTDLIIKTSNKWKICLLI
jgi:hypothetical protein